MEARNILIYLSLKYAGDWDGIMKAIRSKERFTPEEMEELLKTNAANAVTMVDANYPEAFKHVRKPPFVLFYYGNLNLISDCEKCVTIVGSRKANKYGMENTLKIAQGAARAGLTVVSGLAKGIDSEAGKGAVEYGKAVAFLGNGIDYYYPAENSDLQRHIRDRGLLISEYPGITSPTKMSFPMRNRLLGAVSKLTIVGSAHPKSGTLVTVARALECGNDVACLPYRADEGSACNSLIKDGAFMVENVDDVLLIMGLKVRASTFSEKSF